MDILKYTTETRLYSKNNEDVIAYFDEIKGRYNYILRKVYYIIKSNPKINIICSVCLKLTITT